MSQSALLLQRVKLAISEKDFSKAKDLLFRLTTLEDFSKIDEPRIAEGCYHLSYFYLKGYGVGASISKYVEYIIKSYELGYKNAGIMLGQLYMEGKGLKQNVAKGLGIFIDLATTKNDPIAMYNLGRYYLETEDNISAFNWFLYSAEGKYKRAYGELAKCYKYGIGTDKKYNEAEKWFKKALPDIVYALELAELYEIYGYPEKAYVVYINYGKADINILQRAINLIINDLIDLDEEELKHLSKIYNNLYHTKELDVYLFIEMDEPRKAFMIYEALAKEGIFIGMLSLADCYQKGIGCEPNYYLSAKWYLKAENYQEVRKLISNGKLVINKKNALLFKDHLDIIKEKGDIPTETIKLFEEKIKESDGFTDSEDNSTDTETYVPEIFAVPYEIKQTKGLLPEMTMDEFAFLHSEF